ncbi:MULTISPECIES: TadE/TadG family type IV pilus assembly protein [Devosia]|uniref:TadE/TadG family type IV pilus assembly protein n=1 Tax=Devosia TaxID=46913 RepID=UPI0008687A87|nr:MULTISPECIES: TadE/TadG family type IV pilus assembly protein [Devosia]ODT49507.1 MAG: hypothetical protein ABS74_08395 [Pelagibacterium sp. SCN 63-126]ODU83897.1 MAG: hypothetical protein ABT14_15265 [Pelagibacterium sp. SCN 63-17]OJX41827.1 MAG: hypothetical protein BGO80_09595 [Devosia sp. 63-57]
MLPRFLGDSRAASAVEFALLIAPFILLLFGIIEFSRAWWTKQAIQDVAGATARCFGVGQRECLSANEPSAAAAAEFARSQAAARGVRLEANGIVVTPDTTCQDMEGAVEVMLSTRFDSVFPFEKVISFSANACFLDWSAL